MIHAVSVAIIVGLSLVKGPSGQWARAFGHITPRTFCTISE